MAATSTATFPRHEPFERAQEPPDASRKPRYVVGWAVVGAAFLAVAAYSIISWIASGRATPTPTGADEVPGFMMIAARTWEIAGIGALALFLWFALIRPWRREGKITLTGLITLAFLTLYWQDPLLDYSQVWASYSSAFINLGSWTTDVPGWIAPNANLMPEPIVWAFPQYAYLIFGGTLLLAWIMRKAKARWPRLRPAGLIAIGFSTAFVIDVLLEPPLMMLGYYHYAGAIPELTLFSGHYFQYPIYEGLVFGATWTAWASILYFRDDKGRTIAERGIDYVRGSARKKTFVRFLALVGVFQASFLLFYNVPMSWFAQHSGAWPEDVVDRSYLTNGLCGPGTEYACPGPGVPIPRPDSAHLGPDGRLNPPAGGGLE